MRPLALLVVMLVPLSAAAEPGMSQHPRAGLLAEIEFDANSARLGDMVRIRETRPLSKLKRWSLEEIVRRSSLGQIEDTATAEDAK